MFILEYYINIHHELTILRYVYATSTSSLVIKRSLGVRELPWSITGQVKPKIEVLTWDLLQFN